MVLSYITLREALQPGEAVSLFALAVAVMFKPQVVLKANLAALTAVSTSSFDACWYSKCLSPVAGLIVENVMLLEEIHHSLSLYDERVHNGIYVRRSQLGSGSNAHEKTRRD